ncbi:MULTISPECIES: DUF262 domain-containing protein [unclassified Dietzia]|uniref:DUF262 domain-containing protein n=1 Tax=unclassified Dietzia TaxID=2617939 RepID=UPI0015FC4F0A|nr:MULTISPECIES: DUF262 domain-containing protein [unclassified Dietzia]MBB1024802.1 DUF262 domain-containing protein [Dietzia sp. DQ12-76]MBB1028203.1 DUF262 domain-containing protein [Dietzia sp. DQ11-38-2]
MTSQLTPELLTVKELFGQRGVQYEIPVYQRNYAWGKEQIDQLLDDIWKASTSIAGDYFLGNLIVAPKSQQNGDDVTTYEVVDGQQRLTTLFMLLHRLQRESLGAEGLNSRDLEAISQLTYSSRRVASQALQNLSDSEEDEGSGILTGYKQLKEGLARLANGGANLGQFARFLLEKVCVVRAALPEATDLNRYFEVMNTRGQQLEQVDIVKARLMSYLGVDNSADSERTERQRATLAWVWDACADMGRYIQMALTPGDTNLRAAVFGVDWDRLNTTGFDDLVDVRGKVRSQNMTGVRPLTLSEAIDRYARIKDESYTDLQETQRFQSPIRFPTLLLHALKVMHTREGGDDEDDGRLDDSRLVRLFDEEFGDAVRPAELVKRFIETLLRCKFVLDNAILKREFVGTHVEDGAWSLKRLGKNTTSDSGNAKASPKYPRAFSPTGEESDDQVEVGAGDPTRDVLLLQSVLRITYTSPRNMHWITRVLRRVDPSMPRHHQGQMLADELRNYIRGKVRDSMPTDSGPFGFAIERIVYTYLDYLLVQGYGPEGARDTSYEFQFRNSVEHFFPQHANRDNVGWDALAGDDDRLHYFGNLALVSVSANSKFSNELPASKVLKEGTIKQSPKLVLMAAEVKNNDGLWDGHSIEKHHREMVAILSEDLAQQSGGDVDRSKI